jgi:hypothetical protein
MSDIHKHFASRATTDEFSLDMLICACFEFPVRFNESKLRKIILDYFKMQPDWWIELTENELLVSVREIIAKYKES